MAETAVAVIYVKNVYRLLKLISSTLKFFMKLLSYKTEQMSLEALKNNLFKVIR